MKRLFAIFASFTMLTALTWAAVAGAQPNGGGAMPPPGASINISYFYESLASDGQWFQDPSLGWCWTPYDVSADWRPYHDGHWEYSDYGWSWVSDESWGWAPYHYGRWFFDDSYGWSWVPGTQWAPAWVAWRYGDDWVGWAPLPPSADWDDTGGLTFADPGSIPSQDWCFVPRSHVLDVSLRLQVTSVARNVTLIGRSRDATRFEVRGGRPANIGFDIAQVEITLGHRVPRVRIVDADTPSRGGGRPAGSGAVGFYRPPVEREPVGRAPLPSMVAPRRDVPSDEQQRQRIAQQRKLESDLNAEHARLARDQQNDLRAHVQGPGTDEIRKQHAAEQQAFDAHAAQQRQVMEQRIQKQVIKPAHPDNRGGQNRPANAGKPDNGKDKGNGNGNGNGNGKGNEKGNDKGNDKGGN